MANNKSTKEDVLKITKEELEKVTRIEFRSPDPAANPYLAFARMLNAGLKGIEEIYPLPEPLEKDAYHLSPGEMNELGIECLPGSLIEAIEIADKSGLLKETLGEHIFDNPITAKRIGWDEYRLPQNGLK